MHYRLRPIKRGQFRFDNGGFQVGTISEVGYITNKLTQRLKASIFILSIEIMSDMYKHLFILKN